MTGTIGEPSSFVKYFVKQSKRVPSSSATTLRAVQKDTRSSPPAIAPACSSGPQAGPVSCLSLRGRRWSRPEGAGRPDLRAAADGPGDRRALYRRSRMLLPRRGYPTGFGLIAAGRRPEGRNPTSGVELTGTADGDARFHRVLRRSGPRVVCGRCTSWRRLDRRQRRRPRRAPGTSRRLRTFVPRCHRGLGPAISGPRDPRLIRLPVSGRHALGSSPCRAALRIG
jgi:hypothetical protein